MFVLTVFWITLKRMAANWRMAVALVSGLILAVGIMASIPTYATGSLQRSFQRDWRQEGGFRPPFTLILAHNNERRKNPITYRQLQRMNRGVDRDLRGSVGSPVADPVLFASLGSNAVSLPGGTPQGLGAPYAEMCTMSNLELLVELPDGRWPERRADGVVEALVHESTFEREELVVGSRFDYWYQLREGESVGGAVEGYLAIPVQIVGFFREKPSDEYWIYPPPYSARFFVLGDDFDALLQTRELRLTDYDIQWVFDHRAINVGDLSVLIDSLQRVAERAEGIATGTAFWHSPMEFLQDFHDRAQRISLFLTALGLPVIGVVMYYIAMAAGLSVAARRSEVVSLQGRGAGRSQIALSFLLEWLVLAVVALAVGPYLGLLLAQVMGLCSGFLSFVGRTPLPAVLGRQAWTFAATGCSVAVLAGMLPTVSTFRFTVVTFRQQQRTKGGRSSAHRFFLDVVLLAAAFIAYRELLWQSSGLAPGETVIADPILLLVPVIFILGAGLAILRLFPLLTAAVGSLAGRLPGVVVQMALRRMTRGGAESLPVLVLLILTLAMGIYTSATARTLASNLVDRVRYEVGADLATVEEWQPPSEEGGGDVSGSYASEPPLMERVSLPGVALPARVFRGRDSVTTKDPPQLMSNVNIMAIDPADFYRVAWFRSDLAPAPFAAYLGMMVRHPEGALVDTRTARRNEIELGDRLVVNHKDQDVEVYVAGTVPHWPSLNPYQRPFLVLSLSHFQAYTRLEPYEVWYDMKDPGQVQGLVEGLATTLGVYVTEVRDAEAQIVALGREPYRVGFYGVLSVGYIVSALITVTGYAFFTVFAMRRRAVQFAAFRAMGMSGWQTAGLIGLEQILIVGTGVLTGWGLGEISTRLFLPFLRDRAGDFQRLPPFLIVTDPADTVRVLLVFAFVLTIGIVLVVLSVARLHVGQTVRLGEDQ